MQYHYTMWNGNGTTDPLCLAVFHRHELRTRSEKTKTPIVVHCRYDKKSRHAFKPKLSYLLVYKTLVPTFLGTQLVFEKTV